MLRCLRARQSKHGNSSDEHAAAEAGDDDDDGVAKVTVADDDVIAGHFACWRLDRRGAVGETALHLCLLYSKLPEFRAISVAILDVFPKLSVDYYEGDEYYGKYNERYLGRSCLYANG